MLQALGDRMARAEHERRDASCLAEAESLILEAKDIFTRRYGENADTTISADGSLANLALARGDLARADSIRETLPGRYQQTQQGGYAHIWALVYLGEVKLRRGKEAEADTLFRQALELARRHWSAHDHRLAHLVIYINEARAAARVE